RLRRAALERNRPFRAVDRKPAARRHPRPRTALRKPAGFAQGAYQGRTVTIFHMTFEIRRLPLKKIGSGNGKRRISNVIWKMERNNASEFLSACLVCF